MKKPGSFWSVPLRCAAATAAVLLVLVSCQTMRATGPRVYVSDQPARHGELTVSRVVSEGPGWLVIHADVGGEPGAVLGFAPVKDGANWNLAVKIDSARATSRLWAMLHVDAGEVGAYEFPGPDMPVSMEGKVVMRAFSLTRDYGGGGMGY